MKTLVFLLAFPAAVVSQNIGDVKMHAYHEYIDTVRTIYSDICTTYDTYPSFTVCDSIGQEKVRISRYYVLVRSPEGEDEKIVLKQTEEILTHPQYNN